MTAAPTLMMLPLKRAETGPGTPTPDAREHLLRWVIVLTLFVTYTFVLPRWADWNQNSRLNLVLAVVREHRLETDTFAADTGDRASFHGHYYSEKSIGTALLALAPVALADALTAAPAFSGVLDRLAGAGGFADTMTAGGAGLSRARVRYFLDLVVATDVCVALPSALTAGVMFSLLRAWLPARGPRAALTLAYGLGTPALAYSGAFYGHQAAACALFLAFALLMARPPTPRRLAAAGLILGLAVLLEFSSAVALPFFAAYAWLRVGRRARRLGPLLLLLLPLLLQFGYDWGAFGSPFATGYRYTDFAKVTPAGFQMPTAAMVWGVTFSPFRGIFFRAPWLLLAVPGFITWGRAGRGRAEWLLCVGVVLALLLYNVSYQVWWGGFSVGPRHFVSALPFFVPAVAAWWRSSRRPAARPAAVALVVYSVILCAGESWARQAFPPEAPGTTWWTDTVPFWRQGDIARNLGMSLRLHHLPSLLPLALLLASVWGFYYARVRPRRHA